MARREKFAQELPNVEQISPILLVVIIFILNKFL